MKCPKCGGCNVGYDDMTIMCCTEIDCDWNEFGELTAERDALKADNDAHVTVRDKVRASLGCEPHVGLSDASQRVVAERNALAAQLAALRRRLADAERVVALGYVEHSAGKFFLPSHGVDKYGTYALLRLEEGET